MSVKKNLVKATSATTGTGTITLSALTGWALFSAAYADASVVPYLIENGDNKEVGLGTVGAGNTLARTTVLATLVGGVYDDTSPVAITLSGTSTVSSGPLAELFAASEIAGLGTAATYNTGTSGATVPLLNGANTWSGAPTFQSTDAGANGFDVTIDHASASPAAFDILGRLRFLGRDSAAANVQYAAVAAQVIDTTAGSIDGRLAFLTAIAGAGDYRLFLGNGLYTINATGADMGIDTINAKAVYDDSVLLTCYAIDACRNGSVDVAFWDSTALDLDVPAIPERADERPVTQKVTRTQRVRDGARIVETLVAVDEPVYDELPVFDVAGLPLKGADGKPLTDRVPRTVRVVTAPAQPARTEVKTHAPAARFAARAVEMLDPKLYGASWNATGHLPAMPSPAEWDAAGKKMALGDIQQRLWETVEIQAIHIDKLLARIEALETRVTALGG